jgi:hypothetical protein
MIMQFMYVCVGTVVCLDCWHAFNWGEALFITVFIWSTIIGDTLDLLLDWHKKLERLSR